MRSMKIYAIRNIPDSSKSIISELRDWELIVRCGETGGVVNKYEMVVRDGDDKPYILETSVYSIGGSVNMIFLRQRGEEEPGNINRLVEWLRENSPEPVRSFKYILTKYTSPVLGGELYEGTMYKIAHIGDVSGVKDFVSEVCKILTDRASLDVEWIEDMS